MYSLVLLGGARVEGAEGPAASYLAQQRQLALLALLATAGPAGRSRDKIQGLLWPESASRSARHSLSDALYRIRTALGRESIHGSGEILRLNLEFLHTDVAEFESLLDRGSLSEAVACYGGPFMDGFHLKGAGEFEDWRSNEAHRLGQRLQTALEKLATEAEGTGDPRKAEGFWRRLNAQDPFNTRFVLARMRTLASAGDPGNAIQCGEEHTALLLRELEAEPPPELLFLMETLRASSRGPAAAGGGTSFLDPGDSRPGIAILPFQSLSPRPEDAVFSEVFHDAILTRLQMVSGIVTTGRTSVRWYRNHPAPPSRIAEELNVAYLGECSVLRDRSRLQASFRLLDARSGRLQWAETFDVDLEETDSIIGTLSDIAQRVTRGVGAELTTAEETRIAAPPTRNLSAYELYMIGRNRVGESSRESLMEAIDFFEAAGREDPGFALAYSGIARALGRLPMYDITVRPPDIRDRARAAITKAFELDPTSGEVHSNLGFFLHFFEWDWSGAEREYREGLRTEPGDILARIQLASLHSGLGRHEESVEESLRVLAMDPKAGGTLWASGNRMWQAGRPEVARALFERAIRAEPTAPWAFGHLAFSYARDDPKDLPRATELLGEFVRRFGYSHPERMDVVVRALSGDRDLRTEAVAVLDDVVRRTHLIPVDMIHEYAALSPIDDLFDRMAEAVETRHIWVPWVPICAVSARPEVMDHPRWGEFLGSMDHPGLTDSGS